jgi:hypothetical protein
MLSPSTSIQESYSLSIQIFRLHKLSLIYGLMLFAYFQNPEVHAQSLSVELNKRMYAGGYNITCHGVSDGSVSAQESGGTVPYTISWSASRSATN